MIEVIDNFITERQHQNLLSELSSARFPWYKSTILTSGLFKLNPCLNIQFCHRFVSTTIKMNENEIQRHLVKKSEYSYLIDPILDKIEYSTILRIKANCTVGNPTPKPTGFHIDQGDGDNVKGGFTGIYYVNMCNGYTLFQDGTKVESVGNRMLIFDNQMKHSGVACSDNRFRIVINFNWLP